MENLLLFPYDKSIGIVLIAIRGRTVTIGATVRVTTGFATGLEVIGIAIVIYAGARFILDRI